MVAVPKRTQSITPQYKCLTQNPTQMGETTNNEKQRQIHRHRKDSSLCHQSVGEEIKCIIFALDIAVVKTQTCLTRREAS